jgi:predicted MPP superfamily phosphohydrolase
MKRGTVRIAAAGDVHCSPERRREVEASFNLVADHADIVLLAGDLTTHGEPDEAAVLADVCRDLPVPVVTVLGNHDWHANRQDEVAAVLEDAGVTVLDRGWTELELNGTRVGIAGTKGFVGGFPDSALPDFGEPVLRAVYAETTAEVEALERGLEEVAHCPLRIGSDRLARPIAEHTPDLVLHGHGHAGQFEGFIGAIPVFNVSIPVMGRDFWIFELPTEDEGS